MLCLTKPRTPLYLAVLATTCVFAEDENSGNTVVVTASGYNQEVTDAPASISVIEAEELEAGVYSDVTDVLSTVPGVTLTNGGRMEDISLRGMPAEYTAILVNGKKRSGRETQTNGGGAFEQDWLPPLESIERIEVVRGPMSTLYGSDAMGGVINIITKKESAQWHGSLSAETVIQENDDSGNFYQGQAYISGPVVKDWLSVDLTGLYQDREEDNIENAYRGKEISSFGISLHLTPTQTDVVSLSYDTQRQTRTSTAGKSLSAQRPTSETKNNSESLSLSHAGEYDWGETDSYIQKNSAENEGRDITIDTVTFNSRVTLPVASHLLTLGVNVESESLDDPDSNDGDVSELDNQQWALFAEDEWFFNKAFTLASGLRADKNEEFNSNVSGRLYGVWKFADGWTLKSGFATGFRAPDLREMSPEWRVDSRGGNMYGNDDLQPEISINKEISLNYSGAKNLQTGVTVFHNDFKDKISLESCPIEACSGNEEDRRYNNIDSAVTYGVEVNASMDVTQSVSLKGAYTYTYSEQLSGENDGRPLLQIPLHFLSAQVNWSVTQSIDAWTKLTYRGEESDATSESTGGRTQITAPSITYVDLGSSWEIIKGIKAKVGIYNLFNEETIYDEYSYIEDGRRYWFALNYQF